MPATPTRERRRSAPQPVRAQDLARKMDDLLAAVAAEAPDGPDSAPRPLTARALVRCLRSLTSHN